MKKNTVLKLQKNIRTLFFSILILISGKGYSQDPSYGVTNNLRAPESKTSSNHATSVDMFRGRLNSSLPLYNYAGKEINLPISLNYSAIGVRVNQIAENTGLGWNLSFGGSITRYSNFAPDDEVDDTPSSEYCGQGEVGLSSRHDYYKMNIMGVEAVFRNKVYDAPALYECITNPKIQVQVIGQSISTASQVYWKIIAEDGTEFYFGQNNATNKTYTISENSKSDCPNIVSNSTNTWYLTKIVSKNKLDEYLFTYTPFEWSNYITEGGEGTSKNGVNTIKNSQYKIKQQMINEIYHNNAKIVGFVYGNRNDMNFVGGAGNKLEEILLYNFKSTAIHGKVAFSYSYFGDQNNPDILAKRLKLDDINFYGVNSEGTLVTENNFHFQYKDPHLVPRIDSFARDYLGLYNGKDNNVNLVENGNVIEIVGGYNCNPPNSNRSYDFEKSLIGTLTSITNPLKGKTVFEYEQNALLGGYGQILVPETTITTSNQLTICNLSLDIICPTLPDKYWKLHNSMNQIDFANFANNPYGAPTTRNLGVAKVDFFDLSNQNTGTECHIELAGDGIFSILKLNDNSTPNYTNLDCEDSVTTFYGCSVDTRNLYYTGVNSSNNFELAGLTNNQTPNTITLPPGKYQVTIWNINDVDMFPPSIRLWKYEQQIIPSHIENLDVVSSLVDGFRIKSITNLDNNGTFISKKLFRYKQGYITDKVNNYYKDYNSVQGGISSTSTFDHRRTSKGYTNYPDIVCYKNIYEVNLDTNNLDNGYTEFEYATYPFGYTTDHSSRPLYIQYDPRNSRFAYSFDNEKFDFLTSIKKYDSSSNIVYVENYYYKSNTYNDPNSQEISLKRFYFKSQKESYNYINPSNPIYLSEEYDYFDDEYNKLTMKKNEYETVTYEYNNTQNYYYYIDSPVTDVISTTKGHSRSVYSAVPGQLNGNSITRYFVTEIQSSKPNEPLEPKTRFEYDTDGNMVSTVQVTPGTIANNQWDSFIYGYDNRFVVAKLTGIKYSDIPPALINDIKTASNQAITPASITAMETALNALRNSTDANVQNAQITTYTYNPVFGVTSVTDPKGYTVYTEYDAFGRVKLTKEKTANGDLKILSEKQYNTRPN